MVDFLKWVIGVATGKVRIGCSGVAGTPGASDHQKDQDTDVLLLFGGGSGNPLGGTSRSAGKKLDCFVAWEIMSSVKNNENQ